MKAFYHINQFASIFSSKVIILPDNFIKIQEIQET